MYFKKTISPVVAVALLLVTAVVATVGFQTWFNDYSSQIFTDTETKSSNSVSQTGIDSVVGNTLYFRNSGTDTITVTQVEVNGEECYGDGTYSSGVSEIDLYDCMNNLSTTTPDVVVYTNDKIYSKKILVPESFVATFNYPEGYFVSVWDTTLNSSLGSSVQNQINLPLETTGTYNFNVNWGDGNTDLITTYNQAEVNHTYSTPGKYIIKINGTIVGWRYGGLKDKLKLIEIRQWGPLRVGNSGAYFQGAANVIFTGSDSLDLNGTTTLSSMFNGATSFVGDLNNWDTSLITAMSGMFSNADTFNQDLSNWNVSNVITMQSMFNGADSFNQNLSSWDVSNVNDLAFMFFGSNSFDGDLSNWDVSEVTTLQWMFFGSNSFDGDLSNWNVSSVINMNGLFQSNIIFNQNLSSWDVNQVTDCGNFNLSATSWLVLNQPDFAGQGSPCTP